jgi:predicted secreted hydrolase
MTKTAIFVLVAAATVVAQQEWRQASRDYSLAVPRDHVSHPAFKIEWWYYTGNLDTSRGRRFGYQATFFRIGVDLSPKNPSRFAVRDLYLAHAAVTDVEGRRYVSAERLNRAGAGTAGASASELAVWNADWEARSEYGRHKVHAREPHFAFDLTLTEDRPAVLHGDHGYSQKGATPGNASEYYSLTRMPTEGTVTIEGEPFQVRGASWMDHEFGTTFLEKYQQGWDWFALQLEDGTDLMLFELRRRDGSIDPQSSGTLVPGAGQPKRLGPADFTLTPGRRWTSAASGGAYPVEWQIRLPSEKLDLAIKPCARRAGARRRAHGHQVLGGRHRCRGNPGRASDPRPRLCGADRLRRRRARRHAALILYSRGAMCVRASSEIARSGSCRARRSRRSRCRDARARSSGARRPAIARRRSGESSRRAWGSARWPLNRGS